jgi:hypothetical protein
VQPSVIFHHYQDHAPDLYSKEDKSLIRVLQITRPVEQSIALCITFVVNLRREGEHCKPEVQEYEIEWRVADTVGTGKWEDERRVPEGGTDDGLVDVCQWREEKVAYDTHLEDEVLVVREFVQEVPGDPTTTMELSQIMALQPATLRRRAFEGVMLQGIADAGTVWLFLR